MSNTSPDYARLTKLASTFSVVVAVTLILTKAVAYWMTDSMTVMSSLADSCMDAIASVLILLTLRYSLSPPDVEHRFGHGKAEAVAALFQSLVVALAGLAVLARTGMAWLGNEQMKEPAIGMGVMGISLVLTCSLVLFQRHVIRKVGSVGVAADSAHYVGDIVANVGALLIIALQGQGVAWADKAGGLVIGSIILCSAWPIANGALDMLMDKEVDTPMREEAERIIAAVPGVLGFHDLRSRRSGGRYFFQVHVEVEGRMPVLEAHEIAESIEQKIRLAFPGADCIVHLDPLGHGAQPDTHVAGRAAE